MNKIIAVTGSKGFIGTHLVKVLIENNYKILELNKQAGYDVSDISTLSKINHFDTIVHLSDYTFVPESFKNPSSFFNNNFLCMLNVLELARKFSANVIFFSSYLYGHPKYLPINEKHPIQPHNPYAQSKVISEKLCEGYYRDYNIPITILRPFNVYGPMQKSSFIIPNIINQIKSNKIILNDLRPKRDFVYITDVINAVKLCIENKFSDYNVFNLGSGISISIQEITNIILKIYDVDLKIECLNKIRKGEILDTIADVNLIKEKLCWEPKVSIDEGINQIKSY